MRQSDRPTYPLEVARAHVLRRALDVVDGKVVLVRLRKHERVVDDLDWGTVLWVTVDTVSIGHGT